MPPRGRRAQRRISKLDVRKSPRNTGTKPGSGAGPAAVVGQKRGGRRSCQLHWPNRLRSTGPRKIIHASAGPNQTSSIFRLGLESVQLRGPQRANARGANRARRRARRFRSRRWWRGQQQSVRDGAATGRQRVSYRSKYPYTFTVSGMDTVTTLV